MSHKKIQERVVEKIKEHLRVEKITQAAFAKKIGWSASDLNDILRGRKNVGWKRMKRIRDIVGEPLCVPERGPLQPAALTARLQEMIKELIQIETPLKREVGAYRRYQTKKS